MTSYDDIHLINRRAILAQHTDFLRDKVFLEFGVYYGTSMLMWHRLYEEAGLQRDFVGFDSFQGIPPESIDSNTIWREGDYTTHGYISPDLLNRDDIRLVKGFFQDSLNEEAAKLLRGKKVGIAHIDCDTYSSTRSVWEWLLKFNLIAPGSLVIYDDWGGYLEAKCPEFEIGEARAHKEIQAQYSLGFTDLGKYVVDSKFYEVKIFQCH